MVRWKWRKQHQDLVGSRFWRDPTRRPYKHIERYLGQKRVLYPLLGVLLVLFLLVGNLILSIPELFVEVFPEGLTKSGKWDNLFQWRFFLRIPQTPTQWGGYVLVLFVLGGIIGFKLYRMSKSFMPLEDTLTAATSRWADGKSELDYQYKTMATDALTTYNGPSGMVVGTSPRTKEDKKHNRVREYIANEPSNTCIVGETRVGKGVFGVEKAIDGFSRTNDLQEKQSMVIHDPSGELYLKWKKLLEERQYVVYLLNLNDTAISDTMNPLTLVVHYYKQYLFGQSQVIRDRGLDQAQAELATLCYMYFHDPNAKEPIWQDAASALFTAGCLALIEESLLLENEELANIYTIVTMIAEMNSDRITDMNHPILQAYAPIVNDRKRLWIKYKDKSVLDFYFQELPDDHPAHLAYLDILASAPAKITIGNVVTHLLTRLKAFRRTGNAKLMAQNSINYMNLGYGKKPVAVFVVVSDQDKSNHEIAASFFDQSFKELMKAGLKEVNRKLPRKVVYLYEEAGNMVKIPELATKMTDGLKVGMSHVIVLQNYEQLDKYGADANTILSNCGNTIVIKTKSKKTREMIVEDLGNRANLALSRQGKVAASEKLLTDSMERIPMLTKDELLQLPFGETVVIRSVKTHDLAGNVIKNMYPIYNHGETRMIETWKYLPYQEYVSTWEEIEQEYHNAPHTAIQLNKLLYLLNPLLIKEKEERRKALLSSEKYSACDKSIVSFTSSKEVPKNMKCTKETPQRMESDDGSVQTDTNHTKIAELDEWFDQFLPVNQQEQFVFDRLSYYSVKDMEQIIARCSLTQEETERLQEEFEQIYQKETFKRLKAWLGNEGREWIYGQFIEILEKRGLMEEE
ncbi:type IV secretion system protein VirD4 [Enterococcus sp. DIV0421]|uniref:type IV secretory system conjugative DNA transfer family protein n=1 Tax=Enterococcus sp. DIV0421 TaxID=2774688 RepID=UPI003F1F11C1